MINSKIKKFVAGSLSIFTFFFSATFKNVSADSTIFYDDSIYVLTRVSEKLDEFFDLPENIYYPHKINEISKEYLNPKNFKPLNDWFKKFGLTDEEGKANETFYKVIHSDGLLFEAYNRLIYIIGNEVVDVESEECKAFFEGIDKVFFSKDKLKEYQTKKSEMIKKAKPEPHKPLVRRYTSNGYLEFNTPLSYNHVYDEARSKLSFFLNKNDMLFPKGETKKYTLVGSYYSNLINVTRSEAISNMYKFFTQNPNDIENENVQNMVIAFQSLASSLKFDTPDFVASELIRIFEFSGVFKVVKDENYTRETQEVQKTHETEKKRYKFDIFVASNFADTIEKCPAVKYKFKNVCSALKPKKKYESCIPSYEDIKINEYLKDKLEKVKIPWKYEQNPQYEEYMHEIEKYQQVHDSAAEKVSCVPKLAKPIKEIKSHIDQLKEDVKEFKDGYEKSEITENTVWSGIDFESLIRTCVILDSNGKILNLSNLDLPSDDYYVAFPMGASLILKARLEGKTLVSKIFMSTSISKTKAMQFMRKKSSPVYELKNENTMEFYRSLGNSLTCGTLLKINIKDFDNCKYIQSLSENPSELEVLFPYNTKLRITNIEPSLDGKYIQISAEPLLE